jgi:hypothetical protein
VPADTLEHLRQLAWLTVNRAEFVNYKINMRVATPENEIPAGQIQAGTPTIQGTQFAIL